jgi:hypothetical protein
MLGPATSANEEIHAEIQFRHSVGLTDFKSDAEQMKHFFSNVT